MATTILPKADHVASHAALWVAACTGLVAMPAAADNWRLEPSVNTQLTWSSNANFGEGPARQDTILEVRPRLGIRGEGGRLRVTGSIGANAVATAHDTQENEVLPQIDLNARLEAVERLFFIEAGYRATQTSENPFGARPGGGTTGNTLTTSELRFAPYIQGSAGPNLRYLLRSDNSRVREIGAATTASTSAGYFGHHFALIERDPLPFGWRLSADRTITRYEDVAQASLKLDEARAVLTYAFDPEFTAGVRAGWERHNFETDIRSRSFSGVEATWRPSPRTTFDLFHENRFFGDGYRVGFNHRSPRVAIRVLFSRGIDTTPQSIFELPPTQNVSALLDAMFTTRYPNPVERARAVQEFINDRNLPTSTLQPTSLVDERVSIVTRREAALTLNGIRNTLTFSIFQVTTEDISEESPFATGLAINNNVQRGASVALTHKLGATTGLTFSLDWSRIRALGGIGDDESTQHGATLQVNVEAGPKTNAYVGGRYRKLESNVSTEGREGAVFVGMDHRF
jgi:uncharacterized protein (PEP-CTERM system associated)